MTSQNVEQPKAPVWFWVLGVLLVLYVAACTRQRENKLGIDAWEHLRALRALTQQLWHPGNPTFASDQPSVRYSPYLVGLAVVSIKTGIDPYDMLSAAAVFNMALLIWALWRLLSAFGEQASAGAILFVMISLWGVAPGYANSYALSDLPVNQVNPSAFSFGLVLLEWTLLQRMGTRGWNVFQVIALVFLAAVSTLDHGMTGAFGILGLFLVAFFAPAPVRKSSIIIATSVAVCAFLLCLAWPWYNFLSAITSRRDLDYWYNPYISKLMFTVWCMPAMICGIYGLLLRDRLLVRLCLFGASMSLLGGVLAFLFHSPLLARFPLLGMIYLHIPIGMLAHRSGIFNGSTWAQRIRALFSSSDQAAYSMLQITVSAAVLFCLVPQLVDVAKQPSLGRAWVTKVLHLRNLQENVRERYRDLLSPIGLRDVVLSDPDTSWIVPAFRGRIVSAMHYELFIPDQPAREQAIHLFFNANATERERENVIRTYDVKWIVLNPGLLPDDVFHALARPGAMVRQRDGLLLLSASAWMAAAPK